MVTSVQWAGVVKATATKFLGGVSNETIRKRLLLAMLERRGRIKYSVGGTQCTWDVDMDEIPMEGYADAGNLTFERHDTLQQLTLQWRGYKLTDKMTEMERLMNENEGGTLAIVNRYGRMIPKLSESARNKFSAELYVDGSTAANYLRIHGLESFMGAGTVAAGDRIAMPDDEYAGLNTDLADKGGTWTSALTTKPNSTLATDWPDGSGDASYDYLSPKLVNYSSTNWGTGLTTWEANCDRVFRQATIWTQTTGGSDGKASIYMTANDLYFPYLNKIEAKSRLYIPFKEAEDLGFPGVPQQEGVAIYNEFDVPSMTSYGMNLANMEIASLYKQLFFPRGPEYSIKDDAYLTHIGFFGNCRYRPKHFSKIYPYA